MHYRWSPLAGIPVAFNADAIEEAAVDGEPPLSETWLLELQLDPGVAATACAEAQSGTGTRAAERLGLWNGGSSRGGRGVSGKGGEHGTVGDSRTRDQLERGEKDNQEQAPPLLLEEGYSQFLRRLDPALFCEAGFSGQHF